MPAEKSRTTNPSSVALRELLRDYAPLIEQVKQIYISAAADRWGVTRAAFAEALCHSAAKRFGDIVPSPTDVASYLESLHLKDLALACGCSQGNPQAWEYFFQNYREVLYASARAIVGRTAVNQAKARDLADSLYAELYGGNLRPDAGADGARHSLFLYFHGRSKLSTWLHAVLAQRHVNALRAGQRTESLDATEPSASAAGARDRTAGGTLGTSPDGTHRALARASVARFVAPDLDRERVVLLMQETLVATFSALPPRDRLRLALYYLQDLTLAQVGRILGEHEATVSRHLERVRNDVRSGVEKWLRGKSLSDAEIRVCFSVAQEAWPFDLTEALETDPGLPATRDGQPKSAKHGDISAFRKDP
ncbi:MAG TPA: sigma-70 family RNA polymerase sigma factor [Candidatus Dormibacteraeota bacterium]|nr:sigma-70 family RNA polymerase sigma factor [Candidatus Dormibacteraeota bacterium]